MEIRGKRVLVLGGYGLVGRAICERVLARRPSQLVATSLRRSEAEAMREELAPIAGDAELAVEWGDIFVRASLKDRPRGEVFSDPTLRGQLIADLYDDLDGGPLEESFLYQMLTRYEPDIIVDCINTATALAYQNVYEAVAELRSELEEADGADRESRLAEATERLAVSQYVPQLIRHIQILHVAMREVGTGVYLKVGTSGTGGMGLNIPFTHSEEKPSRLLLSKSAVAGAHTLLLFLMARTPDGPVIKEVKPSAAIGWKGIGYGEIKRGGAPMQIYDCQLDDAHEVDEYLEKSPDPYWQTVEGRHLESVYVDAGENGYLAAGEFSVLTSEGLMEFVTPEEIAHKVLAELEGGNTGKDVIAALDASVLGPSYRAGVLREDALRKMEQLEDEHDTESIAFELLGPPRLTKLLYEAYVLERVAGDLTELDGFEADELAAKAEAVIASDQHLRQNILSVGTGILLSSGDRFLRGPRLNHPNFGVDEAMEATPERLERWTRDGWLDLRPENMRRWQQRLAAMSDEFASERQPDYSSNYYHENKYQFTEGSRALGKVVGWILDREEQGARIK